jgi:hypothetical protein
LLLLLLCARSRGKQAGERERRRQSKKENVLDVPLINHFLYGQRSMVNGK